MTVPKKQLNRGDANFKIPPINEKERRTLELLFNLLRFQNGLSLDKIRKLMPAHYNNENLESDQKKLRRDIKLLASEGFTIKFYADNYIGEKNIYKLLKSPLDKEIKFTPRELETLSIILTSEMKYNYSDELLFACQKIFHKNLEYFPDTREIQVVAQRREEMQKEQEIFFSLLHAVRDRKPIKISYYKQLPEDTEEREIDPMVILRRNSMDFYLIAFDRIKKAKRRFIIPKILRITELEGDFLKSDSIITKDDYNFHALAFNVHPPEILELSCEKSLIWKLKNFLSPHPYQEKNDVISLTTTNRSALFSFLLKECDVVQSINSRVFLDEFVEYLSNMKKSYSMSGELFN